MESLDLAGDGSELAFTITGQVVAVEASDGVFATFEVADQFDLERLRSLLREVPGPRHLADDASAEPD